MQIGNTQEIICIAGGLAIPLADNAPSLLIRRSKAIAQHKFIKSTITTSSVTELF
jgi:hypothetical protein